MSKPNTAVTPETRTLDRLLKEFRELHAQMDPELAKLAGAPRFSAAYHDALAALYSQLTLAKCLAEELQTEMNRLDDQLPED
jgi:hypothetical protein